MEEIQICPICHEDCGYLEYEGDWCVYMQCGNCGTHTSYISYRDPEGKKRAEKDSIRLWNMGKVNPEGRFE